MRWPVAVVLCWMLAWNPARADPDGDAAQAIARDNTAVVELIQAGRYDDGLLLAEPTLERAETLLGREHADTLSSVTNLARLYRAKGHYADAEPLFRRALEARERTLGAEHPDTLSSVNNLAALYQAQGLYARAEPLYRRTLEVRERTLGHEHRDTLSSINNLASLYKAQGRYGEAEPLYRRALEARQRTLGREHADTLASLNNLAGIYVSERRYREAEPLYRRALEARERTLGPDHPSTLIGVNNLGGLYKITGRYREAEPLYRRALEGHERTKGPDHPDTLISINNLARLYHDQGRYAAAEPLYLRALTAHERTLGPENPATLISLHNLAGLYRDQRRYAEAERLYRRVLEARERVLGSGHPSTAIVRGSLAILLVRTGRSAEALQMFEALDEGLSLWVDTEVRTTQASTQQRDMLRQAARYQNASFSLALSRPSQAGNRFAADLVLRWKKRLAQEDALLGNIARESREPAMLSAIEAVRRQRAALSNVAFDDDVAPAEKVRLRRALEAAEADLRTLSAAFNRYSAVRSARADDVQRSLPVDGTLVEYRMYLPHDLKTRSTGELRLLAVVLRRDRPPAIRDLGLASPAFALAREVNGAGDAAAFDAAARKAHRRLIAPLQPLLPRTGSLYIAPDGPLQALPFEALLDDRGRRLVTRRPLHMLLTGRDLVARERPVLRKGLVAVGGVDFGPLDAPAAPPETASVAAALLKQALDATRSGLGGFDALPQSRDEAEGIAKTYAVFRPDEPAPDVLLGAAATEAALKTLPTPPRVLHLATHGYYLRTGAVDGEPMLQSGVALAGANRALHGEVAGDGQNGILHAVEVQTLNLTGTELVVLSACDTGKGAVDYSEGLQGLPRAFYIAGAKNVLVALWPVGDVRARIFMERFYLTWLAQEVGDPAAALRQTKQYFIESSDPALRDPRAWAPFVLFEG